MAKWGRGRSKYTVLPWNLKATSSFFIPTRKLPAQEATVKSHKLMLNAGIIRQLASGLYHFLPLGLRALEKLVAVIDSEMQAIGGIKISMPILTPSTLWKASGRWDEYGSELFRLKDRSGTEYCLGPTHEESVTDLVGQEVTSHHQLPLLLYQLDRKFRDEMRPRSGLLRGREFWMKDMYSFDVNEKMAEKTYEKVVWTYDRIFKQLDLPIAKVKADPGNIGGSLSHEFHVLSEVGEDTVPTCDLCGHHRRINYLDKDLFCLAPEVECQLKKSKGIEVAHTFLLGTKYSSAFKASFWDQKNQQQLCQMGCYGIGVSRLLAAIVEHGCTFDEERIQWPPFLAPFFVCIVPLTTSQDPADPHFYRAVELFKSVQWKICPGNVVLEDRTHLTLGARIRSYQAIGYPAVVVIGDQAGPKKYQLLDQTKTGTETSILGEEDLIKKLYTMYWNSQFKPYKPG